MSHATSDFPNNSKTSYGKATFLRRAGPSPTPRNATEASRSLNDFVKTYETASEEYLQSRIAEVTAAIAAENYVERANQDSLTESERLTFSNLMNEESALKLIVLERSVALAEQESL